MIGQVLGNRYEIQQQLGKKAGRQTLLTRDLVTGKMVIVKLLSFNSDFEWDNLKLFEREAKTLKFLSHPSIPSYLDYFEENSPSYKGFALVQTYSQLIICTDEQMYKIPVGTTIESQQETEWLSQELSNWLGIPITRDSEDGEN